MTRLTHSPAAFVRKMQISHASAFAFVEGALDRTFFDRVLSLAVKGSSLTYQVVTAEELPGDTGGKAALIAFHKKLRSAGKLSASDFGKSYVSFFFVDKDCDDLLHRRVRCPHVFYSESYDLEGDLFMCGDLHRALSDACGVTVSQATMLIGQQSAWITRMVRNWKAWCALCIISQVRKRNVGCTFDRVSDINPIPLGAHDVSRLRQYISRLASALGVPEVRIARAHTRYERVIERAVCGSTPLKFFKGKWFSHVLQEFLSTQPKIPGMVISGAGNKVIAALMAQVAVHSSCTCCARYVSHVRALLPA